MAGIRSFNVGKAATPGNTFHRHFQYGEGTSIPRFMDTIS